MSWAAAAAAAGGGGGGREAVPAEGASKHAQIASIVSLTCRSRPSSGKTTQAGRNSVAQRLRGSWGVHKQQFRIISGCSAWRSQTARCPPASVVLRLSGRQQGVYGKIDALKVPCALLSCDHCSIQRSAAPRWWAARPKIASRTCTALPRPVQPWRCCRRLSTPTAPCCGDRRPPPPPRSSGHGALRAARFPPQALLYPCAACLLVQPQHGASCQSVPSCRRASASGAQQRVGVLTNPAALATDLRLSTHMQPVHTDAGSRTQRRCGSSWPAFPHPLPA